MTKTLSLPFTSTSNKEYGELPGSPKENGDIDNTGSNTATRELICKWPERGTLIGDFLGTQYPNNAALTCRKWAVDPFVSEMSYDGNNLGSYAYAKVTLTYGIPADGNQSDDGTMSERIAGQAEMLTMPQGSFQVVAEQNVYNDAGTSIGTITGTHAAHEQPGRIMPVFSYMLDIFEVTTPPWANIEALIGTVNNAAFTPIDITFAAGTLMFLSPESERTLGAGADEIFHLRYSFAYRRIPHNLVFNPNSNLGTVGWTQPTDTQGNTMYQTKDFTLLY